jgi:hypothetical protein
MASVWRSLGQNAPVWTIVLLVAGSCYCQVGREIPGSWRTKPVELAAQTDHIDPAVRAARNVDWDRRIWTPPNGMVLGGGTEEAFGPSDPEFPSGARVVWIAGTFESYKVYAAHEETKLYTEINLRVDTVLRKPASLSSLQPQTLLDIFLVGGSLRFPSGHIVSEKLTFPRYDFRPEHRYLLALLYDPDLFGYLSFKRWDLTSGIVVPDATDEVYRSSTGKSEISGRPVAEALGYLQTRLPPSRD